MKTNILLKEVPQGESCWIRVNPRAPSGEVDPKRDALVYIDRHVPEIRRTRIEYETGRLQMLEDTTPVHFDSEG